MVNCPLGYPCASPLTASLKTLHVKGVRKALSRPFNSPNGYICVQTAGDGGCVGDHKHPLHVLFDTLVPGDEKMPFSQTQDVLAILKLMIAAGADVNAVSYSRVSPNQPAADPSALVLPYPVLYYSMEESIHSIIPLVLMRDYEADPRAVEKALLANLAGRPPLLGIPQLTRPRFWVVADMWDDYLCPDPFHEYKTDPKELARLRETYKAIWGCTVSLRGGGNGVYDHNNAASDHISLLEYLVKVKGFDVNASAGDGSANTVLHLHCSANRPILFAAFGDTSCCRCSHPQVIGKLLECGADPNARNAKEENAFMVFPDSSVFVTSLMEASINGRLTIDAFLKHGWDINARDKAGNTALMRLCASKSANNSSLSITVVRCLLKRGADPTIPNNDGKLPIHVFARMISSISRKMLVSCFKNLLKARQKFAGGVPTKPVVDINLQDGRGRTLLHVFADDASAHLTLKCLLRMGADPRIADKKGRLPIHNLLFRMRRQYVHPTEDASEYILMNQDHCIGVIRAAMDALGKLSEKGTASVTPSALLCLCGPNNETLLDIACARLRYIEDRPSRDDDEAEDSYCDGGDLGLNGVPAAKCLNVCSRLIKFLIESGASVDTYGCGGGFKTVDPLSVARHAHIETERLKEWQALYPSCAVSEAAVLATKDSPFHAFIDLLFATNELSQKSCALGALSAFFEAGVDTHARDRFGRTPLMIAAHSRSSCDSETAVLGALLEHGEKGSLVSPQLCAKGFLQTSVRVYAKAFKEMSTYLRGASATTDARMKLKESFMTLIRMLGRHRGLLDDDDRSFINEVDENGETALYVACATARDWPVQPSQAARDSYMDDYSIIITLRLLGASVRVPKVMPAVTPVVEDGRIHYRSHPSGEGSSPEMIRKYPVSELLENRVFLSIDSVHMKFVTDLLLETVSDEHVPLARCAYVRNLPAAPLNSCDEKKRSFLSQLASALSIPCQFDNEMPSLISTFDTFSQSDRSSVTPFELYTQPVAVDGYIPLDHFFTSNLGLSCGFYNDIADYSLFRPNGLHIHACFEGCAFTGDSVQQRLSQRLDIARDGLRRHPSLAAVRDTAGRTPLHHLAMKMPQLTSWFVCEPFVLVLKKAIAEMTKTKTGEGGEKGGDAEARLSSFAAYLNWKDFNGRTALHYAALCAAGVVTVQTSGMSPIYGDQYGMVALLLQHGADATIADDDGFTPLHFLFGGSGAPNVGSHPVAAAEARAGGGVVYSDTYAVEDFIIRTVIRPLMSKGASMNAVDTKFGNTPFLLLCHERSHWVHAIRMALCEYGANPQLVNTAGEAPFFGLKNARSFIATMRAFIENGGMSPNMVEPRSGNSVLDRVCWATGGVRALERRGTVVDSVVDTTSSTSTSRELYTMEIDGVLQSVSLGEACLRQLLAAGADPRILDAEGFSVVPTIFSSSSLGELPVIAKLLVDHGYDINSTSSALTSLPRMFAFNQPVTLLHRVCCGIFHQVDVPLTTRAIKGLLDIGADVNARAIENAHLGAYLPPLGAMQPAQMAEQFGSDAALEFDLEVRKLLLANGADVNVPLGVVERYREGVARLGDLRTEVDAVYWLSSYQSHPDDDFVRTSLLRHLVFHSLPANEPDYAASVQVMLDNGADVEDLYFQCVLRPLRNLDEEMGACSLPLDSVDFIAHCERQLEVRQTLLSDVAPEVLALLVRDCNMDLGRLVHNDEAMVKKVRDLLDQPRW